MNVDHLTICRDALNSAKHGPEHLRRVYLALARFHLAAAKAARA